MLCAVTKLNSVDVRSLCSCTVRGRMSLSSVLCVCVPGVPVLVKSGHRQKLYDQISPGQELQAHTHKTDDNDIRPHTVQEHNEPTSTEFNLVTAQSTAHEPPENGSIYMDRNM